jgi:methylenetetrahydrofolate dehydrogenase (NADP+)/methenyltetrahydrofolate cyclohydrolase
MIPCHGRQLPLPKHIDSDKVLTAINPDKDVDGFHVVNVGRLSTGQDSLVPCTPVGSVMLAKDALGSLAGLEAVVIGRSNIVGKPVAQLLLAENCTVTIAFRRPPSRGAACRLVIVAGPRRNGTVTGQPAWIDGINRIERDGRQARRRLRFCLRKVAGSITPVPGGVGPMTIACLRTCARLALKKALHSGALIAGSLAAMPSEGREMS